MIRASLSWCAILALGLAAVPATAATTPDLTRARLAEAPCAVPAPDAGVTCFMLAVPEDWSGAGERELALPVMTFKARNPARADPIVFLTGGPGVSPLQYVELLALMPFRSDRDVVVIEPRGHGYAQPALVCGPSADDLAACRQRALAQGIDVDRYDTEALSHDLEALRRNLGVAQWNVLGVSYGTFWALHYDRIYGTGVRALVLDSPYPPQAGYDWSVASALNGLGAALDDCARTEACARAFPDLRARLNAAFPILQAHPLDVAGKAMDGADLFEAIYRKLYDSVTLPIAPALADAVVRGDGAAIASLIGPGASPRAAFDPGRAHAWGLNAAVMCADDIPFAAAADTQVKLAHAWPRDLVETARTEGWDYGARCRAWPAEHSDPVMNAPVHSRVPALILVGAFDPITPPKFAEATAASLPNAQVVVAPNASHAVLTVAGACLFGLIDAFLADPIGRLDASCAATLGAPPWRVERGGS